LQRAAGNRAVAAALSVQRVRLSDGRDIDNMGVAKLIGLYRELAGGRKTTRPRKKTSGRQKPGKVTTQPKRPALKTTRAARPQADDLQKIAAALRRWLDDDSNIATADDDVMDAVDEIVGGVPAFQGAEGGFGEHGFASDSTYFEKPPSLRPDKGTQLFSSIYLNNPTVVTLPGAPALLGQPCQEPGCTLGGQVLFEAAKPWREYDASTGSLLAKAPPVCHKTPYAVLVRALLQVVTSTRWATAVQPGDAGWDDMHYELAWGEPTNLGFGHAACNSRTASQGKRQPTPAEVSAVQAWAQRNNYVS